MVDQPRLTDEDHKALPKKVRRRMRPSKLRWFQKQKSRASVKGANLENISGKPVSGGAPSLGKRHR